MLRAKLLTTRIGRKVVFRGADKLTEGDAGIATSGGYTATLTFKRVR